MVTPLASVISVGNGVEVCAMISVGVLLGSIVSDGVIALEVKVIVAVAISVAAGPRENIFSINGEPKNEAKIVPIRPIRAIIMPSLNFKLRFLGLEFDVLDDLFGVIVYALLESTIYPSYVISNLPRALPCGFPIPNPDLRSFSLSSNASTPSLVRRA